MLSRATPPAAPDPAVASALAYLRAHLPRLAALEAATGGLRVGPHCVMEMGASAALEEALGRGCVGQVRRGLLARVGVLRGMFPEE